MGITNIHDALEATEAEHVQRKLTELVVVLEHMTQNDMGHLNEPQARRFIEATEKLREVLTELESGETEHACYCEHCDATHWRSDETEANSTWQQWQCEDCGSWNDKATD